MKLILILIVLLIILQCILSYNIRNNRLISSISSYSKTLLPLSMANNNNDDDKGYIKLQDNNDKALISIEDKVIEKPKPFISMKI